MSVFTYLTERARLAINRIENITQKEKYLIHEALDAQTDHSITEANTYTDEQISLIGGGGGLDNVVEDLTPQLGGDLDLNEFRIVDASKYVRIGDTNYTYGEIEAIELSTYAEGAAIYMYAYDEGAYPAPGGSIEINASGTIAPGDVTYNNTIPLYGSVGLWSGSGLVNLSGNCVHLSSYDSLTLATTHPGAYIYFSPGGGSGDSFRWPTYDGTSGQVLTTNGSGILSFTTVSGGGGGGSGIDNVVEDLTPQLGGNLDVNGKLIVSASNGNITLDPHGTGTIGLVANTAVTGTFAVSGAVDLNAGITLNYATWPVADGSAGTFLRTDGSGSLTWATPGGGGGGISDVVDDLTPQLGGHLDVNGYDIVSISNGDIEIIPHGTGQILLDHSWWPLDDGAAGQYLSTNGAGVLSWDDPDTGPTTFLGLTDTPGSFTASQWVKVNAGATALEFTASPVTSITATAPLTKSGTTAVTIAIPAAAGPSTNGYMTGADKAKLNGIESGADVTDAANVAAAGAFMGDITVSTSAPSGGANGDVWIQVI